MHPLEYRNAFELSVCDGEFGGLENQNFAVPETEVLQHISINVLCNMYMLTAMATRAGKIS